MMEHHNISLILATGSVSLVRAAYRSGNPVIGIGPGNVPVYIGRSADVSFAVDQILLSKTFDNGTVCASEQAVVANTYNVDQVISINFLTRPLTRISLRAAIDVLKSSSETNVNLAEYSSPSK